MFTIVKYESFVSNEHEPFVFVGRGHDNAHQLHVQQPSTYAKPEAASAVLGS
jgi:hypothetical protein